MGLYRKGGEKHKSPPVKLVKILKLFILQKKCQLMRQQVRARAILNYNQNGHGLNVDTDTIYLTENICGFLQFLQDNVR